MGAEDSVVSYMYVTLHQILT